MQSEVTIASWNVLQGLRYPTRPNARHPNPGLVEKIAALNADVLVLPELWSYRQPDTTLAEDVAGALGYELHQWISDRPSRTRENVLWRMAVLTRVPARQLDPEVMPLLGPFGQRAAVRVLLTDTGFTLAALHLYGIHLLLARSPRSWLNERTLFREIAAGHDIVAGDLNMWASLVNRDARPLRPAIKARTYPSPRPHSQIDHILVSQRVQVVGADRLPDDGSDHRALRAVLRQADPSA